MTTLTKFVTRNLQLFRQSYNFNRYSQLSRAYQLKPLQIVCTSYKWKQIDLNCQLRSNLKCVRYYCKGTEPVKDEEKTKCEPVRKPGLLQRFRQMYRDYWYILVPVHLVTSAAWFGGFYYMAKSGVDIVGLLQSWGFSEKLTNPLKDSSMGYIAVSLALYKIATPLRYTVTLGGTTVSINYLRKWGYIKPVPSRDKLKEMYFERKDQLRETIEEKKEEIRHRTGQLRETLEEKKEELRHRTDQLRETLEETKEELRQRKDQLRETIEDTKQELRQCKDQLKERKDNIMSDYVTFKKELKDIKTKEIPGKVMPALKK